MYGKYLEPPVAPSAWRKSLVHADRPAGWASPTWLRSSAVERTVQCGSRGATMSSGGGGGSGMRWYGMTSVGGDGSGNLRGGLLWW
jgi:hypothetical protein